MSGFRRKSIHRKKPDSKQDENADDEAYDRAARSNSIAEQAGDGHHVAVVQAPQLTPAVEEDIEGFQNKFTDTRLEKLPLIAKEKDSKKQRKAFANKMEQCCVVFDFSRKHSAIKNPVELAASKNVKRNALNEAIDYLASNKTTMDPDSFQAVVTVVQVNCFRTFEQPDDPTAPPYDPEDDEPILETGWPHLQLVYALLLKALDQKAITADVFLRIAGFEFVRRLIGNMGSCDPRERDSAKSCVHRAYGRFMPVRSFVRKILKETMVSVAYDTSSTPFHGTTEMLEFYGCIVNGFVSPIKAEHKALLIGGLLPLHRCKPLGTYHRQLVYCVTQFLGKAPDLVSEVLPYLLSHWPKNNAPKELLYISELEAIMRVIDAPNLESIFGTACRRIARCAQSVHFMVAERSLGFWNNQVFLQQVRKDLKQFFPILAPALHYNNKRHWSGSIHDHNDNAMEVMTEIDPDMFMELAPAKINSEAVDKGEVRAVVESKWDQLVAMANANPVVNKVAVIDGVPTGAAAVPDVFMKGETTSPHRQYRIHKRTDREELDAIRHPLDVAARLRAEKDDEAEEDAEEALSYDDDSGEDNDAVVMRRQHTVADAVSPTGTVPVSNARSALTRRKSVLALPNRDEIEAELANFHPEPMDVVPPSPITSPLVTPITSDDDMLDEIDKPISYGPVPVVRSDAPPPSYHSSDLPAPDDEEGLVQNPKKASHDNGCWMVKRSVGTFKRSNRRWFAIEHDNSRIAYYTQETGVGLPSADPRGEIPFKDVMKVGQSNRQLVILSSKRAKFTLTAPTSAMSQQWAEQLTQALQVFDARAHFNHPADANGGNGNAQILISNLSQIGTPDDAVAPDPNDAHANGETEKRRSGEYGFSPDGTPNGSAPTTPTERPPADTQEAAPPALQSGTEPPPDSEYGFGAGDEWDLEA